MTRDSDDDRPVVYYETTPLFGGNSQPRTSGRIVSHLPPQQQHPRVAMEQLLEIEYQRRGSSVHLRNPRVDPPFDPALGEIGTAPVVPMQPPTVSDMLGAPNFVASRLHQMAEQQFLIERLTADWPRARVTRWTRTKRRVWKWRFRLASWIAGHEVDE